jgi:hypothetical protein
MRLTFAPMNTVTLRRLLAVVGYVSFLATAPAMAQIGPIQPVLITHGDTEVTHKRPDLPDDYSVPVDVYVEADGSVSNVVVSQTTKNVDADGIAASYMRGLKFLPGLDKQGQPVASMVRVTVNMFKRGAKKVVRVTLKPPPMDAEAARVRQLMCADFLFEIKRIREEAGIKDASLEVMPYLSARLYMTQKRVPDEVQMKFWDSWPGQLKKVVDRCEKDELKMFYSDVLVPALDGALPSGEESATVAAQ